MFYICQRLCNSWIGGFDLIKKGTIGKRFIQKGQFFLVLAFILSIFSFSVYAQSSPLLYTTLQDSNSILFPLAGSGVGASLYTIPINDFIPAFSGKGLRIHTPGTAEYFRYPQISGVVQNIELNKGTVDFWYQPQYDHNDGALHQIFTVGTLNAAGSISFSKRASGTGNDLDFEIRTNTNVLKRTTILATNYAWSLGAWVHFRVTWDSTLPAGVQNARVYINNVEPPYGQVQLGSFAMPSESATKYIYFGTGSDTTTTGSGNGVYDEVKIYAAATPPIIPSSDSVPPAVSMTYPLPGCTTSNLISLTADASDDFLVAGVQFAVDGVNVGVEDTTPPYAVPLDTLTIPGGMHLVTATARDFFNNLTTTTPVNFTSNNGRRPNIVIILTDDQRYDSMQYLPITLSKLLPESIQFTNAFVSTSQCCPSRASILTGLYSHNHGVFHSDLPNGGATVFDDKSTLATWLQKSGYRTGFVGKYLNDYSKLSPYVPPGWSDWRGLYSDIGYNNYKLIENGSVVNYGTGTANYSTSVFTTKAVNFINSTPSNQPLFLYFSTSAPHAPATPHPQDVGTFSAFPNWRPLSYNETDVSDKPAWVQGLPDINSTTAAQSDALHRSTLESLQAVDRGFGSIYSALQTSGRLRNTYIIFMSDNGLSWGEHRWVDDKTCPYEECQRVPLLIRKPGLVGRKNKTLVMNVDVPLTIAELTGVIPELNTKGLSLVNVINGTAPLSRNSVFFEWQNGLSSVSDFHAVRTSRYMYAEYNNGERELYDLLVDPNEMDNVYSNPNYAGVIPGLQIELAAYVNA